MGLVMHITDDFLKAVISSRKKGTDVFFSRIRDYSVGLSLVVNKLLIWVHFSSGEAEV